MEKKFWRPSANSRMIRQKDLSMFFNRDKRKISKQMILSKHLSGRMKTKKRSIARGDTEHVK
jgi:hypothetical protein